MEDLDIFISIIKVSILLSDDFNSAIAVSSRLREAEIIMRNRREYVKFQIHIFYCWQIRYLREWRDFLKRLLEFVARVQ
jgi:hypothetical protein